MLYWISDRTAQYQTPQISTAKEDSMKGSFGGIVLIVVGAIALAHNMGYLDINLAQLMRTWWPLILIALGIGFFFTPDSGRKK
jgi:uncharacterized membrane protein